MKVDILNTENRHQIIYADPPREYKESGSSHRVVKAYYPTMTIEDIKELPIKKISNETSILFIWITFPRLEQGFDVIKAWGFQYYGLGFDWVKMSKNGSQYGEWDIIQDKIQKFV